MAISNKKRKEYVESLYSKNELKQIAEFVKLTRMRAESHIQDFLALDETLRILKKHFKLTDKQVSEIVEKHRIPSKGEERLLKMLHGN